MLKSLQKGFTLIELMIVVAIIGILAAIAIPAYQDYLIRSQVSEGLTMAAAAKAGVSEFYANRGDWPADNSEAGLGEPSTIQGKYVQSIEIADGGIQITFGNEANAAKLASETVGLTPPSYGIRNTRPIQPTLTLRGTSSIVYLLVWLQTPQIITFTRQSIVLRGRTVKIKR